MLLASAMWLWFGYEVYTGMDPQGEASSNCIKQQLKSVSNGADMMVTAHETACSGFGASMAIYIYVHKKDEAESSDTHAFRFDEYTGVDRVDPLPKIEWIDKNNILISVDQVADVNKARNRVSDINITYHIGKLDATRTNLSSD